MDEVMKVYYIPARKITTKVPKKNSNSFFGKRLAVMKEVVKDQEEKTRQLARKHPMFPIAMNWLVAICLVVMALYGVWWAYDTHVTTRAQALTATALADYEADQQAIRDQELAVKLAEENSAQRIMQHNSTAKAKLGYGSRNFIEKYNYSDADFMTLYKCVDNRLKHPMYAGMTIDEIVAQEGQFIGYSDLNPVLDYYYNLAIKSEEIEQNSTSQPVPSDYIYTVYTPHGIYLTNDPKAPEYTWWHYSGNNI